jgi:hypothetical protein
MFIERSIQVMSLRKFTSIKALILITALMICALSACGAPAVDKESAVESAPIASANTIATAIIQEVPIDYMAKLEPETIPLHYDFDLTLVDDYAVYMSTVNTSADEIAIFYLKEGESGQQITQALNAHIQMKIKTFQTLSPNESEKLSHARLIASDRYIALLVCAKIDSAYAILTNYDQFPAMTNTAAAKKGSAFSRKGD